MTAAAQPARRPPPASKPRYCSGELDARADCDAVLGAPLETSTGGRHGGDEDAAGKEDGGGSEDVGPAVGGWEPRRRRCPSPLPGWLDASRVPVAGTVIVQPGLMTSGSVNWAPPGSTRPTFAAHTACH